MFHLSFFYFWNLECNGSDRICEYYFETIEGLNKRLSLNYCPVSRNYWAQIIVQYSEMFRTTLLTLLHSLQVDVTLDPATAAAWLLLSPDGKKVKTQWLIFLFIFTPSALTGNSRYWSSWCITKY